MKDRGRDEFLSEDVRIRLERSSSHPVEYAIVLLARRDGRWHTLVAFDNAHGPREHHEHRYVGGVKQEPLVTHGDVNDAMHAALITLRREWVDIVSSWETNR